MDHIFEKYQPRCHKSIQQVTTMKMAARVRARQIALKSSEDDDDFVVDIVKKRGTSFCIVSIGNRDLANIVNGFSGDAIELRPFDYCFQKTMIIDAWRKVGFIPMTANAVNNPKVRYELGEGGAPGGEKERLESLVADYRKSGEDMIELGFNGELLDLQPVEVATHMLPENEAAAVKLIVDNGSMNSAGSLFWAVIFVANCSTLLQECKQKWQQEKTNAETKERMKKDSSKFLMWMGLKEFGKWFANN